MENIFKRSLYILGFVAVLGFFADNFIGEKAEAIELPPSLAAIKCLPPPENEKHANNNRTLLGYDSYAIYSLCIPADMMGHKDKLKCGYGYDDPGVLKCDGSAVLEQSYVHAGLEDIYATDAPTTRTPNPKSKVTIELSQQPLDIRKPEFQYYTKEDYIWQGVTIPSKFIKLSEPVCQSPLNRGAENKNERARKSSFCFVNVANGNLNVKLEIESFPNDYGKLKRSEQIEEINFWLKLVDQLIVRN